MRPEKDDLLLLVMPADKAFDAAFIGRSGGIPYVFRAAGKDDGAFQDNTRLSKHHGF